METNTTDADIGHHLFWIPMFIATGIALLYLGSPEIAAVYILFIVSEVLAVEWKLHPERYPTIYQRHPDMIFHILYVSSMGVLAIVWFVIIQ